MKRKILFSLMLGIVLIIAAVPLQKVITETDIIIEQTELNAYVPHGPIVITSDSEFSSVYSLPGDGSAGSPYMIQNLNITTSGTGILIIAVSSYFEIRDCYISAEVPIEISAISTNFVVIANNTIEVQSGGSATGIRILNSDHFEIFDNVITGYGAGIYAENSDFNYIHDNHFSHFTNSIDMLHCTYCFIYDNMFEMNDGDQYVTCDELTFYNNTWLDNNNGLYLGDCSNCNVTKNFFFNTNYYAVTLYQSITTIVYENWFINNHILGNFESQAKDEIGSNQWSWNSVGNFWSDFSGEGFYEIDENRYDQYPIWDSDSDGLNEYDEIFVYGTDELDYDTDDDYLPDGFEIEQNLDPLVVDSHEDPDIDDLTNLEEYIHGTHCQDADTDGDVMTDGYEVYHSLNPLFDDSLLDFDGDGLANIDEFQAGTKANNFDSDSDGMNDFWELNNGLNPLENDAWNDPDQDNLNNFLEYVYGCNPNLKDTDSDGHSDSWEILNGTNPNDDQDYPQTEEPTDTSDLPEETTFYWIFGIMALLAITSFPIVIQRIRINKLRELVKEYFPRQKF